MLSVPFLVHQTHNSFLHSCSCVASTDSGKDLCIPRGSWRCIKPIQGEKEEEEKEHDGEELEEGNHELMKMSKESLLAYKRVACSREISFRYDLQNKQKYSLGT